MANGKIMYPTGATPQTTYTFVKNFDYGHKLAARLNLNDDKRTFDGTAHRYAGPAKKTYELTFSKTSKAEALAFLTLWDYQCPMDLYLDGVNLDAAVMMMESPEPVSEAAFGVDGVETYSFDVRFEEI